MQVNLIDSQKHCEVSSSDVSSLVEAVLASKKACCDEVSIHLVDKEEISRLHEEYFDDPTPTDCITFPVDDPYQSTSQYKTLGDVFVCPEVAYEYSQTHATDFNEELTLYIVHGILHILGFDDINEEDKKVMRTEENSALSLIKDAKLLLSAKICR